jgi:hypothetical protein
VGGLAAGEYVRIYQAKNVDDMMDKLKDIFGTDLCKFTVYPAEDHTAD